MSFQPRDTRVDNGNWMVGLPISPEEQGRREYARFLGKRPARDDRHEITVTTEIGLTGDLRSRSEWDEPQHPKPQRVRRQVRCSCGWWEILHDETPEQIQAMHDDATR